MQKTFSIKTLGCKLNQYESSLIAGQLNGNGWITRPFGENVDLVIVNTCTVTNKSDKKCRNYIRQGAKFSNTGKVLVTGCLADLAEKEEGFLKKNPEILAVVRNSEKENIFSIVQNYFDNLSPANKNNQGFEYKPEEYPLPFYRTRGLLKIQDGCDGECSYCIVPTVRGKSASRDIAEILTHAGRLIDSGCPELILTGITIGKFNSQNVNLAGLVKKITDIKGAFRVRITSIEPNHVSDELIQLLSHEKVCPHIHIPVQSGSDAILNLMKRPYTIEFYLKLIEKIKKLNDDISIGTDIIVGFPEESESDFASSLDLVEKAGFSYVHQFTFSAKSGTPASLMKSCPEKEVGEKSARMRELSSKISLSYKKRYIGKSLFSVIEKNKGKKGYRAVSGNYIKMDLINDKIDADKIGKLTNVLLDSVDSEGCAGVL